jgi:hypothetical protein
MGDDAVDADRNADVELDVDADAGVVVGEPLRTALTHGDNLHGEGTHGTKVARATLQAQVRMKEQGTRSRRAVGT